MSETGLQRISEYMTPNRRGLRYPPSITIEEWTAHGEIMRNIHTFATEDLPFLWGDWLREGGKWFGNSYAQAVEMTDYSVGYLRNAKWVCGVFPPERRRDSPILKFSHYFAVAGMDTDEQEKWLDKAIELKLNTAQFREAIRFSKNPKVGIEVTDLDTGEKETAYVSTESVLEDFTSWFEAYIADRFGVFSEQEREIAEAAYEAGREGRK